MKYSKTLLIILLFMCIKITAQDNFKGKITYEVDFEIYHPEITKEQLYQDFGSQATFFYDLGKYYQTYIDGSMEFDIMDSQKNLYYNKRVNNDTIFVYDATLTNDQNLLGIEKSDSNQIILGNKCDRLKLNAVIESIDQKYSTTFYFTKNILIDGSQFKNIKKSFANVVYGEMNSIPIKFEIESPYFKIIVTATDIDETYAFDLDQMINERLNSFPLSEIQ